MEKYIRNLDESSAIALSNELNQLQIRNSEECILRFDDNISCTPFGMLLVGNTIKEFRNMNPCTKFSAKINSEANAISYAGHMGFFKTISEDINYGKLPGEALGSSSYVPITKIDFLNYRKIHSFQYMEPLTYIEYESEYLANVLAQGDETLKKLFTYLIREMIRNSNEHGNTDCAWVCAQNWKSRNIAEIAILDNGIGYKKSLMKKYGDRILNDEFAIRKALEPGITESFIRKYSQEDDNSGYGLYMASEICNKLNGSFTVVSGKSYLKKQNSTIITKPCYHSGTIIKLLVDTTKKFDYYNLLSETCKEGEQKQRTDFKASELSKGKLILRRE